MYSVLAVAKSNFIYAVSHRIPFSSLSSFPLFLCVCVMCHSIFLWQSENNLWELIFVSYLIFEARSLLHVCLCTPH